MVDISQFSVLSCQFSVNLCPRQGSVLLATDHWQLATVSQYQPIGASFRLICTCLTSRYSSMPHGPSSRPKPDCLKPPQGASTYVGCIWLTQTIPARKAFTARMALKMSRVQTAAARP